MLALATLAAAGVVALVELLLGGARSPASWGYVAAALAFLLSTAQAAPPLAFASRLARGFWGISLRRAADLWVVAGLVTTPLLIVLLTRLPDWHNRPSIWLNWPGAPGVWDAVGITVLLLAGLALLWAGARPDRAAARALRGGSASAWRGTVRAWSVLTLGMKALGGLYLLVLVFVHLLVVSDLALSLVPGWSSPNMPPYHAVTALQAGIATTLLTLAALRYFGGLERYIRRDAFHAAGKLLLSLSLLWFYFTWAELLTYWYGRTPAELHLLDLLMFGPYLGLFAAAALLNFVLPFLVLLWNRVRLTVAGPTLAAALVLLGNYVDRVRIYVAAWSVAGPPRPELDQVPAAQWPGLPEVLVLLGMPAAALLLYLLALRLLPAVSLWEYRAGALLEVERPYLKTRVPVIAKPS